MKCRWYADFEGVCTNGECPYRGDTCPTSEYPEVCRHAEATQGTELNTEELVTALRYCAGEECKNCLYIHLSEAGAGVCCDDYLKQRAADMLEKLAAEKREEHKIKTPYARIYVSGTPEKPYYGITYFDLTDGEMHSGFGSYSLDFVFKWFAEEFDVAKSEPPKEDEQ